MTSIAARISRVSKASSPSGAATRQAKRQMLGNDPRAYGGRRLATMQPVGTVDKVRGDRIILTKDDSPDGRHQSISCALIDRVEGDTVILDRKAEEAKAQFGERGPRPRLVRARRRPRCRARTCSTGASPALTSRARPTGESGQARPRSDAPGPFCLGPRRRIGACIRRRREMARAWHLMSRPNGMPTADDFALRDIALPALGDGHGPRRQPLAVGRSLHARPDERREKLRPAVPARRADGRRRGRRGGREPRPRLRARRHGAAHGRLARRGGASRPPRSTSCPPCPGSSRRRSSAISG